MSNHDDGGEDSKKSIGEKDLDVPLEASPRMMTWLVCRESTRDLWHHRA